ncbi:hypothetical protein [Brevundimonas sp.]|jgi:hypothetical protein|uniref:hypothetical protein n=1 Tax=Brevundimonas sp. TaxID=1871086 RepID=UPI003919DD94
MTCDDILALLSKGNVCELTSSGLRVTTHCLYPSFDPVEVFVTPFGEGFIVNDGGGASASAWDHGREGMDRCLAKASARFGVLAKGGVIEARASSADWLKAAILGVANASAAAAEAALERTVVVAERAMADRIFEALAHVVPKASIAREFEHRGSSGKNWRYDFGVSANDNLLLVNAVAPHHASISAKYVAFADTPDDEEDVRKLAVYSKKLETADATLITQVATLVPVGSVERGVRRVLSRP